MIDNVEKKCTGCGACANICSVNAITMGYDDCGFYTPVVDYDKCVKCGKCLNVCCALDYKSKNDFAPDVYAVAADDVTRMNCTSGGAFPVIAKWVLDNDGFVCGAAWDNEWNVQHIVIDNINDLCKLNYSKYVQSNTNNCFTQIQSLLNDNRTVLFSGTPCQNAGLLKFLDKDYSNLITVDLLCHGTPSPKVWQDYLKLNYNKSKINSINFRAKYQDWNVGTWTSIYDTNYGYIEEDKKKKQIGIFYEAFIRSILSNNTCVECQYKYVPRPADFTIGDFWYFRNNTEFDSQKGLSALLLNSNKAKNIFKNIFTKFKICKKVDINNNWENLEIYKKSKDSIQRKTFFEKYKSGSELNKILNEAVGKKYDVALLTMFNIRNYGSALVSYAANRIIEGLGYSTLMIHKELNDMDEGHPENRSFEFAKSHYNISRFYKYNESCKDLNRLVDTFIVCSDTMWWDTEYANDYAHLDFAESNKRKIAFCTSFAHTKPAMNETAIAKRRFLFKRFNALSTREETGVQNLKEFFDTDGEHLYDPTLIANREVFDELASSSKRKDKNILFAYILDLTPEKEKAVKYVADKLNLNLKLISNMRYEGNSKLIDENNITLEDFIYYYKNADFIISDSFHGTCFSVIYEKPFISIVNSWRGYARYKIFRDMNLGSHLLESLDDIYKIEEFNLKPNFSFAKEKICQEKEKAIKWLRNALQTEMPLLDKTDLLYDYLLYTSAGIKDSNEAGKRKVKYKNIMEKVFSVKNLNLTNKKYKVITLFGVRIKISYFKHKNKVYSD